MASTYRNLRWWLGFGIDRTWPLKIRSASYECLAAPRLLMAYRDASTARGFAALAHAALSMTYTHRILRKKKPSRAIREGCNRKIALGADDVARLKALGAFQQIEFHGFTLVKRAVTVFLNRGEMYKNVLPCRALDEAISLRPVEPLYCSLLSH